MSHSERAYTLQGSVPPLHERYRIAFSDLLERNQRHSRENLGVLKLFAKFIVGADHAHDNARLCRGRLQLIPLPLQNGIPNGFCAVTASEEVNRLRAKPWVNVQGQHVTAIPRFMEDGHFEEWTIFIRARSRRMSVDRFPFPLKEATKAPESFPNIHRNVLRFPGSRSPECGHCKCLRGKA